MIDNRANARAAYAGQLILTSGHAASMDLSLIHIFAHFHQAISRTRPLYNRANLATRTEARERFRRFVSQIASFPNSLVTEKPLPTRFRSRNVTNATSAAPSANRHTVNRVHHSESSRFGTTSRQKLSWHSYRDRDAQAEARALRTISFPLRQ